MYSSIRFESSAETLTRLALCDSRCANRPGEIAVAADMPWGRLGLTICYDLRFPALYRALAESGASFLAIPSAFTRQTGEAHWHVLMRARAIENTCYVAAAAQVAGQHLCRVAALVALIDKVKIAQNSKRHERHGQIQMPGAELGFDFGRRSVDHVADQRRAGDDRDHLVDEPDAVLGKCVTVHRGAVAHRDELMPAAPKDQ